jgi:hypothetical protein
MRYPNKDERLRIGDGSPTHVRAIDLLDRLLSSEITIREFFRLTDHLSDNEVDLLGRMLLEQYWKAKAKEAAD